MKITKLPFETKISCECGCEFEFDYDDINIDNYATAGLDRIYNIKELSINCPLCHFKHILKEEYENE